MATSAHQDSLEDFTNQILAFRNARDWKQFHKPKDMALSLALEAAEVLEHFQWKNDQELDDYLQQHKNELADELIDVLYWVLLISRDLNIDLRHAFKRKMRLNRSKYPIKRAKGKHKFQMTDK